MIQPIRLLAIGIIALLGNQCFVGTALAQAEEPETRKDSEAIQAASPWQAASGTAALRLELGIMGGFSLSSFTADANSASSDLAYLGDANYKLANNTLTAATMGLTLPRLSHRLSFETGLWFYNRAYNGNTVVIRLDEALLTSYDITAEYSVRKVPLGLRYSFRSPDSESYFFVQGGLALVFLGNAAFTEVVTAQLIADTPTIISLLTRRREDFISSFQTAPWFGLGYRHALSNKLAIVADFRTGLENNLFDTSPRVLNRVVNTGGISNLPSSRILVFSGLVGLAYRLN